MTRKLAPHCEFPEQIEQLLDALAARGWLSEARFAESRANTLARKFGSRKIEYDLKSRGVSDEVVERTLEQALTHELDNCRVAWEKKFGVLPHNAAERGRQMRFLAGRGFSAEAVRRILKTGEADE